jgi:NADPH-dependent 2,4-dienoyl-CoA reductase/sulfur reductase-like enzyme
MNKLSTEVLVVGGGAAGMAAAVAASDKASVTLVDDNPHFGGQIWRAEQGRTKSPIARRLIDRLRTENVKAINDAPVFASPDEHFLLAETGGVSTEIKYDKLIIATGARELFLPFPGWTIPGVFGAGGLQALVKGGFSVENKRVVVAGTGPLLLAVADLLKQKGADALVVAEQTSAAKLGRFAAGLLLSPSKLAQAVAIRSRLAGVKYLTDCWVASAAGNDRLRQVTLTQKGKIWSVDCDFLACGFHLVPNTELAEMLGCRIERGFVAVDEHQRTSREKIYCAGEPTGIAGVESSLIEGTIAGLAATGREKVAQRHRAKREKARRFGRAMASAFSVRDELRHLATDDTTVCRCEDVEYGSLTEFDSFRDAKLQTRCGMGPCQGRICGAATEFLFGWQRPDVRPPIFPVKMEDL